MSQNDEQLRKIRELEDAQKNQKESFLPQIDEAKTQDEESKISKA